VRHIFVLMLLEVGVLAVWFAKNASGAKTHVSTSIASRSREPGRRMWGAERGVTWL
jgi:hypothetical protein